MTSKKVFVIHAILFWVYTGFSLSSPFFVRWYQALFAGYYLFFAAIPAFAVLGAWIMYGDCPFTKWENRLREHERPGSSYRGLCTNYYIRKWCGFEFPEAVMNIALAVMLLLPLAVGIRYA